MKTLVLSSIVVAVLGTAIVPVKAEPVLGRYIGDGIKLPREYVLGKPNKLRVFEITTWMIEHGAKEWRACDAKRLKGCAGGWTLKLTDGGVLSINSYPTYATYCRSNSYRDSNVCYTFESGVYNLKIKDTQSGQWTEVWNSSGENTTIKPKDKSDEIEM